MDFDFYDQYKNYSNVELLKICKQPANFQAAAIDAAKEILKSRNVSEEELRKTENYFTAIQTKEQAKKDKINNYKEKAADLL
jgi:hypothetical protein